MIILESIRLRNFRAVREAFFQPKTDGISGLHGPNGSGKSTFLAATLFALFGVRPKGATVASLRRTNSGTDECSVSVVFKHLNQTVEIIRELKGNNNRVVVDIYVDGIPQTVTSVGAADTWISQRIGVDATGFLTAFIVRQKELDALITAGAAERKAIIEKLAGIETINEALKKARKDESAAKIILESLPGSESRVEEADGQVQMLSDAVNNLSGIKEEKQAELAELQEKGSALSKNLENLRKIQTQLLQSENTLSNLRMSIDNDKKTIARLGGVVNSGTTYDLFELREQHKTVSALIEEKTLKVNNGRFYQQQLLTRKNELAQTISELESEISNSLWIKEDLDKTEIKINNLTQTVNEKNKEVIVLDTKTDEFREKIVALEGVHKNCPTCNHPLDDVHALVESFETLINEFALKKISIAEELIGLNDNVDKEKANLVAVKNIIRKQDDLVTFKQDMAETEQKISELPDVETLAEEIKVLTVKKEEITETGFKAKQFAEAKTEYDEAIISIAHKTSSIQDLEPKVDSLKNSFSSDIYEQTRIDLDRIQNRVNYASSKMNEVFAELSTYQTRLTTANSNLKSSIEQWERKKELFKAQERKALTTEVIDKFRQDSIASLTPELSERATELISEITSGAYTEVRLDESFNVSVVNSAGEVRDVGWLSGGEESAVAFSLRLAIAFLITGDNPSLLWLDEVLTAQDADRRNAMLSTIRHLPIDQIILINHTAEAADIVDLSVTVVPNIQEGSTLVSE